MVVQVATIKVLLCTLQYHAWRASGLRYVLIHLHPFWGVTHIQTECVEVITLVRGRFYTGSLWWMRSLWECINHLSTSKEAEALYVVR